MRNKNKKYNQVVKSPTHPGKNARGADAKHVSLAEEQMNQIRAGSPVHSLTQDELADLIPETRAAVAGAEKGLANEPFLTRYGNPGNYNTLFLDRSCQACSPSQAPQILAQIKLACLSYVNSPIRYGPILPRPLDLGRASGTGAPQLPAGAGLDLQGLDQNRSKSPIQKVGPHCYIDLQVGDAL